MTYENLIYRKRGNVSTITINRPAVDNAVNAGLVHELADVCDDIRRDGEVKAVIITGRGKKSFCTGIELGEFPLPGSADPRVGVLSVAAPVAGLACHMRVCPDLPRDDPSAEGPHIAPARRGRSCGGARAPVARLPLRLCQIGEPDQAPLWDSRH